MTAAQPQFSKDSRPAESAPLVVHVIHRLSMGGMENGLVNLINNTPTTRMRHAIICLTSADGFRERIQQKNVPIVTLDKKPGYDFSYHVRLWRALRLLRPSIVHTRNIGTLETALTARAAGVRAQVHGLHGWDVGDLHGTKRTHLLLRRLCDPCISRYVAVSNDMADWLRRRVPATNGRIVHICNGVDTTKFAPFPSGNRDRDRRQSLPPGFASPEHSVIAWVGRMEPVKDPLLMARAFVRALERNPALREKTRLMMIGAGSLLEDVRRCLTDGGVADCAWTPGARNDVADLLQSADVYALTSLNEGISNTILEAMAIGLPVVATRVGGNLELVDPERAGSLVDVGDVSGLAASLERYIADSRLRDAQSRAARARAVSQFSLAAMISKYLDLYDELLGLKMSQHAAA